MVQRWPPAAGGNGPLTIVANFVHTQAARAVGRRYFSLVSSLFLPRAMRVPLLDSSELQLGVAYITK